MGQAKRRGSFEERKRQAVESGREKEIKSPEYKGLERLSRRRQNAFNGMSPEELFIATLALKGVKRLWRP
jgi:hypothetical protein